MSRAEGFIKIFQTRSSLLHASLIVCLLGIAGGLRLWGLGEKSIWHDEAFTLLVAKSDFSNIPAMIARSENHPPLGYLLTHAWMALGNFLPFLPNALWLRLPSAIAGILTVPLLFHLGKDFFKKKTCFLAALLVALHSYHLFYSQEIRSYTLGILWITFVIFLGYRAVETGKGFFALFVSSVLALYTTYMAGIVLFVLGIWWLGRTWNFSTPLARHKESLPFFLFAGATIAAFLPWLLFIQGKLTRVADEPYWLSKPEFSDVANAIEVLICGYPFTTFSLPFLFLRLLLWLLALVTLAGALHPKIRSDRIASYLALFFLLPFAGFYLFSIFSIFSITGKNPLFHPRFLIWFLPGGTYCLAAGILEHRWEKILPSKIHPALPWLRNVFLLFLVGMNLFSLAHYDGGEMYEATRRFDYAGAARFVKSHFEPGDKIVHFEPFSMMPFRYFLYPLPQHQFVPPGKSVPYYLGGTFLTEAEIVRDLDLLIPDFPNFTNFPKMRIWLVLFQGRKYPGFSPEFLEKFEVKVVEHARFRGLEVVSLSLKPKDFPH